MVGVEVANQISSAIEKLGAIDRLIIDLRGNIGGGIGALRVMSLLTPDKIPVGFALDRRRVTVDLESEKQSFRRFSRISSSKKALWLPALRFVPAMMAKKPIVLQTEGLGQKPFHGRIILLVNRHRASAAEMIVAFAHENQLATVVGEKTARRLLVAMSVKVGGGFRLALPTGAYYTWKGLVLEGVPIEPDDITGRQPCCHRLHALALDRQHQALGVVLDGHNPIGMPDCLGQTIQIGLQPIRHTRGAGFSTRLIALNLSPRSQ